MPRKGKEGFQAQRQQGEKTMTEIEYQEMQKSFWAQFEALQSVSPQKLDFALRRYFVANDEDPGQGVRDTYENGKIKPDAYSFVKAYVDVEMLMERIADKYRNTAGHDGAACAFEDCAIFLG